MANTSGSNAASFISRSTIDTANRKKVPIIYDYPYGKYRALNTFFTELSRIQTALISGGKVRLPTGQEVSSDNTGGLLAIQLTMQTLDTTRESTFNISDSGSKLESKLWTLQ